MNSSSQKQLEASNIKYRMFPSTRLLVTLVAGFGIGLIMICRYNVSMAMVCMVDDTQPVLVNQTWEIKNATANQGSISDILRNSKLTPDEGQLDVSDKFQWDKTFQGLLLSSYFYGYTAALVPGGWVSDKLPANIVLIFGFCSQGVTILLFPVVARYNRYLLLALRAVQGLCCSVVLPSATVLLRNWSVPVEYTTLFAVAWSLSYLLGGVTFPLSSFLCQLGGWPLVYYVTGALPVAWGILAWFLIATSPDESRLCTEKEKKFIIAERTCRVASFKAKSKAEPKPPPTPFLAIVTNPQVLIVIGTTFANNWFYYALNITLPTFLQETMGVSLAENGLLSGLPSMSMTFGVLLGGRLFQHLLTKWRFQRTNARKIIATIAFLTPAALLGVILVLPPGSRFATMILLCASNFSVVLGVSGGPLSAGPEIAPQYAGVIWGMAGSIGNMPGLIAPVLAAAMTPNKTLAEWRLFFLIAVVILVVMDGVILLFWKSEVQPFAKTECQRRNEECQHRESKLADDCKA